jgi:hypothetical protein
MNDQRRRRGDADAAERVGSLSPMTGAEAVALDALIAALEERAEDNCQPREPHESIVRSVPSIERGPILERAREQ